MTGKSGVVASGVILFLALSLTIIGSAMAEKRVTVAAVLGLSGPGPIARASIPLDIALKDCIALSNREGGINGKKIRYVVKDDHYKPATAVRLFEHLMQTDAPPAVFGSGTPAALAVQPLIRDRYRVLYTSSSFSAKLAFSGRDSTFVPGPTYGDQIAVALKYIARTKKGARVALFYSKGPLGEDPIPFGRIMCRRLRLPLVAEAIGDLRGGDHRAQIEELKSKEPDFVIIHGWVGPPNAELIRQCHNLGLKSQIIVTLWGAMKSVVEALGPEGPTFYAVSPYAYWWMDDVPMIRRIREYTSRNYPDVKDRPLTYVVAFVAGKIFVECLRNADTAGKLNGEGVLEALQSVKNFDTGGLTPPLTIKQNRFPVARILKSIPEKGIFEPATDWEKFY